MTYTEETVVKSLSKKSDLHVNTTKKIITETWGLRAKHDVGIKSRGKISYLVNHQQYTHIWEKS